MDNIIEVLGFYVNNCIDAKVFENWVYTTDELESFLGEDIYIEIVSSNFNDLNSVVRIKNILRDFLINKHNFDISSIHDAFCEIRAIEEHNKGNKDEVYKELYSKYCEPRKEMLIINVSDIENSKELHNLLKSILGFPKFYGMSWDAFGDAITGLVEMPKKLVIVGWTNIMNKLPEDAIIMKELLEKFNKQYPSLSSKVEYK